VAAQSTLCLPPRPAPERTERDDGDYPCVSEARFRRRERGRPTLPLTDLAAGLPDEALNYLQDTTLQDAIDAMGLLPLERDVLELRAAGAPIREISERLGVRKWRVERAVTRIRARYNAVRRAPRRAPAAGWQEVYLSETRRVGKK
jgi:hypothetical protein